MDEKQYESYREETIAGLWEGLLPFAETIEDTEHIANDEVFPILRKLGAFGFLAPEEYGGADLTVTQYIPILKELAKIHGGLRALVHSHNSTLHAFSDLVARGAALPAVEPERLLRGFADGTMSLAMGITEPDHGTGADIGTTAVRSGEHFVVNGNKWLITNSDFTTHMLAFVRTGDVPGATHSLLLLPLESDGVRITPLPELMGCKGGEHGHVALEDVKVPADHLLGKEGEGIGIMEEAIEVSRLLVAISSLGVAERALELAVAHSERRVTFGKPLAARQAIQRYLAEMAMDVYAMQTMILDAAGRWDRGERIPVQASSCKLFGIEAVARVTDRALLVLGGIGYSRAYSVERLARDARLNWLEEGPPTVQMNVIASAITGADGDTKWFSSHVGPEPEYRVEQLAAAK